MESLIQAVPVERDGNGWWTHPGLPDAADDPQVIAEWLKRQRLRVRSVLLEDVDGEHPYWSGECHCRGWEPIRPEGEGWFCLCILDSESGPVCWWVRRVDLAE